MIEPVIESLLQVALALELDKKNLKVKQIYALDYLHYCLFYLTILAELLYLKKYQ